MNVSDQELQSRCISLLFGCPAHKEKIDCPLSKIRGAHDFVARILWLKQIEPTEMRRIYHHHVECFGS